ncbi:hypothetical protein MYCTH_2108176 [Thermothelomyces thermophilus ATCC 42464]|uniref:Transcription factor domain-containing protein n=1 Tax=Thermothelomyces thermophilus (strain ATCC 42464 / BCRC 31852 / DSM 1799) TaxID=573729 RepID=G2Q672_THET4|nr:uncharacterized protein MYCTH_2108176 [Thermothelomyces thermophilus ATCC 42464]AEO55551.1 hypothetical protein MYCTH_2108176 [Thermothelomyces thermophilus ATCC 42464]
MSSSHPAMGTDIIITPSSCHYAGNVRRGENGSSIPKAQNLTERLRRLEALVSSLATKDLIIQQRERTDGHRFPPEEPKHTDTSLGTGPNDGSQECQSRRRSLKELELEAARLRQTHDGQVNYVDPSHWLSILLDIREVRKQLSPEGAFLPPQGLPKSDGDGTVCEPGSGNPDASSGLSMGLGATSLNEILGSLPPRPACDRLLSQYFNSRFMVLGIIHPATADITAFEGEIRRRVWINLFQLGALVSFQMGFPSMIPSEHCDAQPPRNLDYSDFGADTATLTPSRPLSVDTPVVYPSPRLASWPSSKRLWLTPARPRGRPSTAPPRSTSRQVWAEAATSADAGAGMGMLSSSEAHTATFALDLMLRKVSEKKAEALLSGTTAAMTTTTTPNHAAPAPPLTADMSSSSPPSLFGAELPCADVMSDIIDDATAPDWNLLDQYFQNPTLETAESADWNQDPAFPSYIFGLE